MHVWKKCSKTKNVPFEWRFSVFIVVMKNDHILYTIHLEPNGKEKFKVGEWMNR